jgi:hypothetical protein
MFSPMGRLKPDREEKNMIGDWPADHMVARIRGWVAGKTRRTCLAVASGLFIPSPERLTGQPAEHEAALDDEPERE